MSRRDTIIVAVLVNAALLMILFATAMRSGDAKKEKKEILKLADAEMSASKNLSAEMPLQEDLLSAFVAAPPTLAHADKENILTLEEVELDFSTPVALARPPAPSEEIKPPAAAVQLNIEPHFVNVTVKKGDFLEKIAKANNTSVAAIMKANSMNSTQLKIGQVLKIPLDGKKAEPSSTSPTSGEGYYIVKEGDNPWLIASRNKINLEELLRLNGLDEQKAKRLRPGDKLKIR